MIAPTTKNSTGASASATKSRYVSACVGRPRPASAMATTAPIVKTHHFAPTAIRAIPKPNAVDGFIEAALASQRGGGASGSWPVRV